MARDRSGSRRKPRGRRDRVRGVSAERLEERVLLTASTGEREIVRTLWDGRAVDAIRDSYVLRMPQTNPLSSRGAWDYQSNVPLAVDGWTVKPLGRGYFSVAAPGASQQQVSSWATASGVLYVSPNRVFQKSATRIPNDPNYISGNLWGLSNTGQAGGTRDADIDAPEAWATNTGSRDVVVVVMDDGIDWSHPDLQANLWNRDRAAAKVPAAVKTDFTGEYGLFGWDSADGDDNVKPLAANWHGTAVAGVIGAVGNNRIGSVGVNWNVSMYAAKVFGDNSAFTTLDKYTDAVNRVIDLRVKYNQNVVAVNASFGEYDVLPDPIEAGLVTDLGNAGILFVAAAGNGNSPANGNDGVGDLNDSPDPYDHPTIDWQYYPATIDEPNVISVAASTRKDTLARFSDWGPNSVQIAAPGEQIWTTLPNNGYGYRDGTSAEATYGFRHGTSMAAPHVTGVAALVAAEYFRWTRQMPSVGFMRQAILDAADRVASLTYTETASDPNPGVVHQVQENRRLNADASVRWVRTHLPPAVSVTAVTQSEGDAGTTPFTFTATLLWYNVNTSKYEVAKAVTPITVSYSTEDDTAQAGTDYNAVVGGTFTIPVGDSSAQFTIDVNGDTVLEPTEQFRVKLSVPVFGADFWLRTQSVLGVIRNDEPTPLAPAVTFDSGYGDPGAYVATMEEGNPGIGRINHSLLVQVDGGGGVAAARPVTVAYRVYASTGANAATPRTDFIAQAGTITIPAGQKTARLPVRIVDDPYREADETFRVEITAVTPGVLKLGQQCTVTITDPDTTDRPTPPTPATPPTISISGPAVVGEADGTATFDVTLDGPTSVPVRVIYGLISGTARSGLDFIGTAGLVTIPAGEVTASFQVRLINDRVTENTEKFTVKINAAYGATFTAPQSVDVEIVDDEIAGAAQMTTLAAFAALGESGLPSSTTVKRTARRG